MLFTDVVMPKDVTAASLRTMREECAPACKGLFTTGYSRNAIVHQGRLDANVNLLSKPYTQGGVSAKESAPCSTRRGSGSGTR